MEFKMSTGTQLIEYLLPKWVMLQISNNLYSANDAVYTYFTPVTASNKCQLVFLIETFDFVL